jgi:hypothetical protein
VDEEKISWAIGNCWTTRLNSHRPTELWNCAALERIKRSGHCERQRYWHPSDRFEEIFEPFHQLDGSSTRRYGGTGLGLALVRKIIEAHGSVIRIRSEIGKGSEFEFDLLST